MAVAAAGRCKPLVLSAIVVAIQSNAAVWGLVAHHSQFAVAASGSSRPRPGGEPGGKHLGPSEHGLNSSGVIATYGSRNVSYDEAVKAVGHDTRVQQAVAVIENRHQKRRSDGNVKSLRSSAQSSSNEGLEAHSEMETDAQDMLNGLVLEFVSSLDAEKVQCTATCDQLTKEINDIHEQMASFSSRASQAHAELLRSESDSNNLETLSQQTKQAVDVTKKQGEMQLGALKEQLKMVVDDLGVMEQVLQYARCDGNPLDTALLQCEPDTSSDGAKPVLMFRSTKLRTALSSLRSPTGLHNLEKHFPGHVSHVHNRSALFRKSSGLHHKRRKRRMDTTTQRRGHHKLRSLHKLISKAHRHESREEQQLESGCSVKSVPSCLRVKENFLQIYGELQGTSEEQKAKQAEVQRSVQGSVNNFEAQLGMYSHRFSEVQVDLGRWTGELNDAEADLHLKQIEYDAVMADYSRACNGCHLVENTIECSTGCSEAGTCALNMEHLELQICSVQKVRQELALLVNPGAELITDCQVSGWMPFEECPVTCGGGLQTFKRIITLYPYQGSSCPPLRLTLPCNEQPCPVDCTVGEWEEWSSCTASCDGGVKQRIRSMYTEEQHGGTICPSRSQAENCHMEACNQDCVLSHWSEWSGCNKGCGGGYQHSYRSRVREAHGLGKCWGPTDPERLRWQPCNEQPCSQGLVCETKMDVILLLDNSDTVGPDDWSKTTKAAAQVMQALSAGSADIHAAVLAYSGPFSLLDLSHCMGWSLSEGNFDVSSKCNMDWVSHMTSDVANLGTTVEALPHGGGTRLTSLALAMASAELMHTRPDACPTVVVITAGRPLSSYRTSLQSAALRKAARLMWVAVTPEAPLDDIRLWSSPPIADNVIGVHDFDALGKSSTIDLIISDLCPVVGVA